MGIRKRRPDKPLGPKNYSGGRFLDLKAAALEKGWKLEKLDCKNFPGTCRDRFPAVPMLCAVEPGAALTLAFEGRAVGAFMLAGPDAGVVEVAICSDPCKAAKTITQGNSRS